MNTPTTAPDSASADEPVPSRAEPALDAVSLKVLRAPAVHRLLALRTEGALTRAHVRTTAQCLAVSDRTVWRWLAEAATAPAAAHAPGARRTDRFEITPQIRVLLAYWRGNASAVHRELTARAHTVTAPDATTFAAAHAAAATHAAVTLDATTFEGAGADAAAGLPPSSTPRPARTAIPGGAPPHAVPVLEQVPSLATFLRAVRRDLTAGELAGYRKGPEAARALDVFGKRPRTWRNHTWEGDHVQAPLRVHADGRLVRPYVKFPSSRGRSLRASTRATWTAFGYARSGAARRSPSRSAASANQRGARPCTDQT
ncbi:hypothetical protein J2S46_007984 [Kitasatospora herbaricolor]|nr:hypothetical protein [Kitasatospora herbaricolor]